MSWEYRTIVGWEKKRGAWGGIGHPFFHFIFAAQMYPPAHVCDLAFTYAPKMSQIALYTSLNRLLRLQKDSSTLIIWLFGLVLSHEWCNIPFGVPSVFIG